LQIQPELRGAAEVARELHGGIGCDTPALQNDVTNARDGLRRRALASAFALKPKGFKYSSRSTSPGRTGRIPFLKFILILPLMRNDW
jgi:hypothetical protein